MNTEKLKLFWNEAKTKLTTYAALLLVAFSQLADHAEDLYAAFPSFEGMLPASKYVHTGLHWAISALGVIVVVLRVRRVVWPKKDS